MSVWDLLFGLMLPSGNDAGFLLADYFGKMLKQAGDTRTEVKKITESNESGTEITTDLDTTTSKENQDIDIMMIDENEKSKYLHRYSLFRYTYVKYFIMEMNYYAREEFKLFHTFFDSPHGMTNRFNTSTAGDIGRLSAIALKNSQFARIVRTRRHKCHSVKPPNFDDENLEDEFKPRLYTWENTNKLLWKNGYNGLKTGITQTAGPCLAASFKNDITEEFYIIVVLNSRSMDHRWNEIHKLKSWTSNRMTKIQRSNLFNENPACERRVLTKIRHL